MYNFIAEAFSAAGAVALILSFQIKNTRRMFIVQCLANLLFCANYLMFNELTAAALMIMGIFSPIILVFTKGDNKYLKYAIMLIYIIIGIITYSGILSILISVAQLCVILAQWTYKPRLIRWVRLCASPFWLAKNITVGWFITGAELFTFVSIVIFLIRTKKESKIDANVE